MDKRERLARLYGEVIALSQQGQPYEHKLVELMALINDEFSQKQEGDRARVKEVFMGESNYGHLCRCPTVSMLNLAYREVFPRVAGVVAIKTLMAIYRLRIPTLDAQWERFAKNFEDAIIDGGH